MAVEPLAPERDEQASPASICRVSVQTLRDRRRIAWRSPSGARALPVTAWRTCWMREGVTKGSPICGSSRPGRQVGPPSGDPCHDRPLVTGGRLRLAGIKPLTRRTVCHAADAALQHPGRLFHVVEVVLLGADDLVVFVALAGEEDDVALAARRPGSARSARRSVDSTTAAARAGGGEAPRRSRRGSPAGSSVRGLSLVTYTASASFSAVARHARPLGAVAVAAAPEQHAQLAARQRPQGRAARSPARRRCGRSRPAPRTAARGAPPAAGRAPLRVAQRRRRSGGPTARTTSPASAAAASSVLDVVPADQRRRHLGPAVGRDQHEIRPLAGHRHVAGAVVGGLAEAEADDPAVAVARSSGRRTCRRRSPPPPPCGSSDSNSFALAAA